MKLVLLFITACIAISCNKEKADVTGSSGKIKVAVRAVGIDEDNITRSETDVMWVNINK